MSHSQRCSHFKTIALNPLLPAAWLVVSCLAGGASPVFSSTVLPSAAVLAHFRAAENAQRQKDFGLAEKEYLVVIARAPYFAPAYLNLGLIKQDERRWREATTLFQKAARLDPNLTGAQFFLGIDECLQGQATLAIPHLQTALRQKPDLEGAYSWLALAQKMNGSLEDEIRTLERGLHSYPRNFDMVYLLGRAYETLGRQVIDELEKANPHSSYVEQWLGEDYAQSGYLAAGLLHFQNAITASPDRPGLHVETGEVYLAAGNLPKAEAEFTATLKLNPHSLRALVRIGEAELLKGDLKLALTDWAQALLTDPERVERMLGLDSKNLVPPPMNQLPPPLVERARSAATQLRGQTSRATSLASAFASMQEGHPELLALQDGPARAERRLTGACTSSNLEAWLREGRFSTLAGCAQHSAKVRFSPSMQLEMGRALFEEDKPAEALSVLGVLPSDAKNDPGVFYWRAKCYKNLALQSYLQLFEIAPTSYRAHQLLADLASARHQDAQAIREYQLALSENPNLPNLHYEIGHLYWKVFKAPEARQEFLKELALNPRHVGALIDMGTTYLYEHDPAKALDYLMSAEKLNPSNESAHEFLGMAYLQLGRYGQAEAELQRVAASDHDGKVHYQLGKVYQALGEKQKAAQMFAAAAKLNLESDHLNEKRVERLNAATSALKRN